MAIQPLPQFARKAYQDFRGGRNSYHNPLIIKESEFTTLDNAVINETSILEKSKGYTYVGRAFPNTATSFIRMLVNYKRGTSVDNLVAAAYDSTNANTTYKVDVKQTTGDGSFDYIGYTTGTASFTNGNTAVTGVGTAWLTQLKAGDKIKATAHADSAYTEIASVTNDTTLVLIVGGYIGATAAGAAYKARIILNKDYVPSALVFNNLLFISNGYDIPYTWNNTTTTLITNISAPKGKFLEIYKNRLFVANTEVSSGSVTADSSLLAWSATQDCTTWDASATETIFPQDNGNICAIKSFADSIIVFKDQGKVYQVQGNFDQDAIGHPSYIRSFDVPDNMGPIAGYTVCLNDDGRIYFVAQTGVYSLDTALRFSKVSWPIHNEILNIILQTGTIASKSFRYDTKTQWDSGTHTGTRATTTGTLESYCDQYSYSDLYSNAFLSGNISGRLHPVAGRAAITIDSNKNLHIVYMSTYSTIKHKKIEPDGTVTETILSSGTGDEASGISLAIAANGVMGLSYCIQPYRNAQGTLVDKTVMYRAYTSGTWGTAEAVATTGSSGQIIRNTSIAFASDSTPRIAVACVAGSGDGNVRYYTKGTGSWVDKLADNSGANTGRFYCSLILDPSDNVYLAAVNRSASSGLGDIRVRKSSNDGASFTLFDTVSGAIAVEDAAGNQHTTPKCQIQIVWNSDTSLAEVVYVDASDSFKLRKRVVATGTTVLDASRAYTRPMYQVINSTAYAFAQFEDQASYRYETTTTSILGTDGEIDNKSAHNTTESIITLGPMASNSYVTAFIYPGANQGELLVKRVAFRSVWSSGELHPSSFTSWGAYSVVDEVTNGATVTKEVALNSASPPTVYTAIADGQTISTDVSMTYIINRITYYLNSLSSPTIGSVTLNYVGPGVGPTLPTGYVFNNETYFAAAGTGATQNDRVFFYDRGFVWSGTKSYSITFMCRYKYRLYAGSSTNGDIYILNNGYSNNADAYTMTAISKEDLLGSLELTKDIEKVYLLYRNQDSGTFTFSYRLDNYTNSAGTAWTDQSVDQTGIGFVEIPVNNTASSIQFKITADSTGVNTEIIGWVILYGYLATR